MQFNKYTVISWDGVETYTDSFPSLAEANDFARRVADEGFTAQVTEQIAFYKAVDPDCAETPEYYGVVPGIDFPATLGG